jgi:hypothetical protein
MDDCYAAGVEAAIRLGLRFGTSKLTWPPSDM